MLTKDDLKSIAEILTPLIKAEGDAIRKNMASKSDLETSNRIMGKIFKIELAAMKQEMVDAMKAGFQEVGKIIGEVKEEIHNERLKQLEERVKKLEKHQTNNHP